MTGKVVHFEIPFDDAARARGFYNDAFGWNLMEMPDMQYTIASTGPTSEEGMPSEPGFINGGLFARGADEPRGPVFIIDVPDIEVALAKIESLGGATKVAKMPVGEMGFCAYFADPEGNVLGLWENA